MAIQTSGTTRISNNGQLQNIGSLDATTTVTIAAAAGGGGAPWQGTDLTNNAFFVSNNNSNATVVLAADNNKGRYIYGHCTHYIFNSNPNYANITFNGTGAWIRATAAWNNTNNGGSTILTRYQKGNTGVEARATAYSVNNTRVDHTMVFEGYLPAGGNMTINRSSVNYDVWDD